MKVNKFSLNVIRAIIKYALSGAVEAGIIIIIMAFMAGLFGCLGLKTAYLIILIVSIVINVIRGLIYKKIIEKLEKEDER